MLYLMLTQHFVRRLKCQRIDITFQLKFTFQLKINRLVKNITEVFVYVSLSIWISYKNSCFLCDIQSFLLTLQIVIQISSNIYFFIKSLVRSLIFHRKKGIIAIHLQ